jgi:hypothetical protein
VAYLVLLFFSSVGSARGKPTPLGFHAADIVLHGVLGVINLALLLWLIPDEVGDEAWVPRGRRGRDRDRRQPSATGAVTGLAAVSPNVTSATKPGSPPPAPAARAQETGTHRNPTQHPVERGQPSQPGSTDPPAIVRPARRTRFEQSRSQETNEPAAHKVENSTQLKHFAARATDAVRSRRVVAVAVLAAVVGIVIWLRRR